MNDVETLAAAFTTTLREWLTPDEWAAVVARNAAETDPAICHSHDFCDANQAMADSFNEVFGHYPVSPCDVEDGTGTLAAEESDWLLTAKAWTAARATWNATK